MFELQIHNPFPKYAVFGGVGPENIGYATTLLEGVRVQKSITGPRYIHKTIDCGVMPELFGT
jgi:hypothetical protein